MDLLLVRHAIAEEPRVGLDDPDRALTDEGSARFVAAVEGLRRLGLGGDACWHSPWRRATQTAALLAPLFREPPRAEPLLARDPEEGLLARLRELRPDARLWIVGHQPWLGELAAWLVFGDRERSAGLRVRKGGLLWLRGAPEPAGMELEAVLKPSLLRRAGEVG